MAVEPAAEVGRVDVRAEQPGAVRHGPHLAVDARIGETDDELRRRAGGGERLGDAAGQRVPQGGVGAADRRLVVHHHLHLHPVVEVAERGAQVGVHVRSRLAGEGPHVHTDVHHVRDDVGLERLAAGVQRVAGERGVGAGVQVRAGAGHGQGVEEGVDPLGVEQVALGVLRDAQRLHPRPPQLVEARRGPVVADPLHDGGRRHQRVVGLERGAAVAGGAVHAELPPGHPLLADVDAHVGLLLRAAVQAAVLGEHEVRRDGVAVVVGHPPHPVRTAALLVGHGEVDQVALRAEAGGGEVLERDGHRGGEVQHVHRAAAPHLAVDQFAAERVAAPAGFVDGHDVGVAHQAQGGRVGVGALDAGHQRLALRRRPEGLEVQPRAAEVLAEDVRVAGLEAALGRAVVDAAGADERLEQLHGLSGEAVHVRPPAPAQRRCARRAARCGAPCRRRRAVVR